MIYSLQFCRIFIGSFCKPMRQPSLYSRAYRSRCTGGTSHVVVTFLCMYTYGVIRGTGRIIDCKSIRGTGTGTSTGCTTLALVDYTETLGQFIFEQQHNNDRGNSLNPSLSSSIGRRYVVRAGRQARGGLQRLSCCGLLTYFTKVQLSCRREQRTTVHTC